MKSRKLSRSRLRKLIVEELAVVSADTDGDLQRDALAIVSASDGTSLASDLSEWLGCLRAVQMWFHAAHHVVSGEPFAGDHGVLYDRIYTEVQDAFDADVEKAIGVSGEEEVACPIKLCEVALRILKSQPSPAALDASGIANAGLAIVRQHVEKLEQLFEKLESENSLTLGLNDHLAAQANTFESYIYLLQQRVG